MAAAVNDIRVQTEDFSMPAEWERLRARLDGEAGAVAAFVGLVREVQGDAATILSLEHYPGMTEKSIAAIVEEAERRWSLAVQNSLAKTGTPP